MHYVDLGCTGMRVSEVGFGCCPLGGHSWGKVDADEAARAVVLAVDRGINLFDTADCYGLGESERRLGAALAGRRADAIIATKFGVRADGRGRTTHDNSAEWLSQALDASLRRLGTDYIDLYQLHYWDGETPVADIVATLEDKRVQGKIRAYGLTNVPPPDTGEEELPPHLVTFSYEYSLARREHEARIRRIHDRQGLHFLSWGSLGQGVLTGKYQTTAQLAEGDRRHREVYVNFQGKGLERNQLIVDRLRACSATYGDATPAQLAMRWILDHLGFGSVLVGIKNRKQLEDAVRACKLRLRPEDVHALDEVSA